MRFLLAFIVVLATLIGIQLPGTAQQPGQVQGGQPGQTQQRTPARAPGTPGEQPAVGTAIVRGSIVTLDSGLPIRRAQVQLGATELRETRVATTDSQGRFEFRELPAGRYRLSARKAGFVTVEYGQRRPMQGGTPIEIRDGQLADRVTLALPRGSVIAGRITDEFGEPVAEAQVSPLRWQRVAGSGRWMRTGPMVQTDDLGQYRLFGLAPGEYLVTASLRNGMMMMPMAQSVEPSVEANGFAPTYFPGVPNAGEATRITVGVGEENTSASFALVATRLVSVEGTVTSSQGNAVTQGMVQLTAADTGVEGNFMGPQEMGRIDRNGRFKINGVAPGRYLAQARILGPNGPNGPAESGEIGRTPVTVGGDKVENVAIVMTAGGRLTGRVITDNGAPLPAVPDNGFAVGPDATRLRVMTTNPNPLSGNMSFGPGNTGVVQANGTFEMRGLVDERLLRVTTPPGWSLKAVLLGGRDYIDTPIEVDLGQTISGMEIVITQRVSSVAGAVTDSRGQPVLDASIIVFPDDQQYWKFLSRHIRTARPDQDGRFRIENLPPHERYLAVAVQDAGEGQANDPAYLAKLAPDAERFSLPEGQGATLNLKLRP